MSMNWLHGGQMSILVSISYHGDRVNFQDFLLIKDLWVGQVFQNFSTFGSLWTFFSTQKVQVLLSLPLSPHYRWLSIIYIVVPSIYEGPS